MKKYLPTLIVVVVAASLFAYLHFSKKPENKDDGQGFVTALSFPQNDAVRLEITANFSEAPDAGPRSRTVLRRSGDTWTVLEPGPPRANAQQVDSLLYTLSSFQAEKKVEDAPEDVSKYGLDNPLYSVLVRLKDKTEHEILIGMENQLAQGYYVQIKGKKPVYIVSSASLESIFSPDSLIDKSIAGLDWSDEPTRVTVTAGDRSATCVKKKDKWTFKGKPDQDCEEQQVGITNLILSTQFDDYVPEKQLPGTPEDLGLKPANAEIIIKAGKKKKIRLAVGKQMPDQTVMVYNKTRDEYYRVMFIFKENINNFFKTAAELAEDRAAAGDADTMEPQSIELNP